MTTALPSTSTYAQFQAAIAADDAQEISRIYAIDTSVLEHPDANGNTPLLAAAGLGHLVSVQKLLDLGASVEVCNNFGCSPIHFAAEGGNRSIVELFLDRGADIEATTRSRETPLHIAARKGQVEAAAALVARRADLYAADGVDGATPLHQAAACGHSRMIELLLDAGTNIHVIDSDGFTPLRSAVELLQVEAAGTLVRRGALADAPRPYGKTSLHFAVGEINSLSIHLSGQSHLIEANRAALVTLFLDEGVDVDATDEKGLTPLDCAARTNSVAAAQVLTERGTN